MDSIRSHFPILERAVYLNSCSQGALSREVEAAYAAYLADWNEKGSPWDYWVERAEAARGAFAALIGADADEVAVTTSVSAAINALASALDFRGARNRVVVTDFDFPTATQIWHAQERRGAQVVHVPAAGNTIPVEHFARAIDERTALVSLTHVCFRNGARLDVPAVVELAHARGARVLLDSYQALGSFPIDVRSLDVDFLVGGVLKYLLGSPGLAYLYARAPLIGGLVPAASGWFAQEDIFAMDIYHNRPSPSARRFDAGTPPIPNVYAALAGIDLIQACGLETIEAAIGDLSAALLREAWARGYTVQTPDDPGQRAALVAIRSHDAPRLVERLRADGIITSCRGDNLRVSLHVYNNQDDLALLFDALRRHDNLLC